VVSTYQAISGAGRSAIDEMFAQARAHVAGQPEVFRFYDRPIHLNVIPKIGGWLPNGDTEEDAKFTSESQKILGDTRFKVWATTVRVPVERCHSESVWVRFERPTSADEITRLLAAAPGVKFDDLATPRELAKKEDVYVSRIRVDEDDPRVVRFWVVGDQLWKGAALNAIQIAEELQRLGRLGA
jgi:aspartate-semialdehyde dehydrogenase